MSFDVFLIFDGDCKEAVEHYAEVFELEMPEKIMYYDDAPDMPFDEANKGRILYTTLPIFGCNVMFSDCFAGTPYVKGTNIALTLGTDDAEEIKRLFAALSKEGAVEMELGETFFSKLYGMVTDKFEITWQLSLTPFE